MVINKVSKMGERECNMYEMYIPVAAIQLGPNEGRSYTQ